MNPSHVVRANALTFTPVEVHPPARFEALSQGRIVRQQPVAAHLSTSGDVEINSSQYAELYTRKPAAISTIAISDSQLPINYLPKGCRAPLKGLVPEPDPRWQRELQAGLIQDNWWQKDAWGDESLLEYQKLVDERRCLGPDEEFKFERLTSTLVNMQTFVRHIRANKQFPQPLTAGEDKAMAWVENKTAELLAAKVPYKRTVHLAVAFTILCEIVTDRQILGPLQQQQPVLFDAGLAKVKQWPRLLNTSKSSEAECLPTALLDPEWVASLCWGGNNPGGQNEKTHLLAAKYYLRYALETVVDNPEIVLFPTFAALNLDDFCRFSHLPVFPIAMITSYALNADGQMMSPLQFFAHDLGHMGLLSEVGMSSHKSEKAGHRALAKPALRLAWRRLLLDRTPSCLAALKMDAACTLLFFQLIHEHCPGLVAEYMENIASSFCFCLEELAEARRENWRGYEDVYQGVTDTQAATAAFWATRLWQGWQAAGFGQIKHELLDAWARRFVEEELPRLKEHLRFVSLYRGNLRQAFIKWSAPGALSSGTTASVYIPAQLQGTGGANLFSTYDKRSGLCHLDNTDVVYFRALTCPQSCPEMIERVPIPVPEVTLFAPGSSVQADA
ncbi:MAG: hypothetical protein OXC07_07885 [Kistimonas sp.]|nr:hypothetical protein [Kistimonas sp.]